MRKTLWFSLSVGLLAAIPAVAGDNGGPGACWIEFNAGNQEAIECIDGYSESECASFCSSCNWEVGLDCTDLKVPWEGSCFFDDVPSGGGCWLWAIEPGAETAEFHCEETFGATWFDDLECVGAPVPTLPRVGQAALVLVLLAGALIVMSLHSRGIGV